MWKCAHVEVSKRCSFFARQRVQQLRLLQYRLGTLVASRPWQDKCAVQKTNLIPDSKPRASNRWKLSPDGTNCCRSRKVRLPEKGNSNFHGARSVHLIKTMIQWIRISRLSVKKSLSCCRWWPHAGTSIWGVRTSTRSRPPFSHPPLPMGIQPRVG